MRLEVFTLFMTLFNSHIFGDSMMGPCVLYIILFKKFISIRLFKGFLTRELNIEEYRFLAGLEKIDVI